MEGKQKKTGPRSACEVAVYVDEKIDAAVGMVKYVKITMIEFVTDVTFSKSPK